MIDNEIIIAIYDYISSISTTITKGDLYDLVEALEYDDVDEIIKNIKELQDEQ